MKNKVKTKIVPSAVVVFLIAALLCGNIFAANFMTGNTFQDVSPSAWYYTSVKYVYDNDLMVGYDADTFAPSDNTTRAMLVNILYHMSGATSSPGGVTSFADVEPGSWYADAVHWAAANQIVSGIGNNLFAPEDDITREQFAVMLSNYAQYKGFVTDIDIDLTAYPDTGSISPWAKEALEWAMYYQLIRGTVTDGTVRIDPQEKATRAQVAAVIERFCKADMKADLRPTINDPSNFTVQSNGRITYPGAITGIDVSYFQGDINWQKVAADGVEFAIIRCGYRGATLGGLYEDDKFRANIEGAQEAGLQVGVYFFSQAISEQEAVQEAEYVLELISGYKLTMPIFYDWEEYSGTSRTEGVTMSDVTNYSVAFCRTIKAAGYKTGVYSNLYTAQQMDMAKLAGYDFWLAQWITPAPTYKNEYRFWQYSETGSVAGIEKPVDMDLYFPS